MPSEDEIRRYQAEHPISPAMKEVLLNIPKVEFDPQAMRRRLAEQFRNETLGERPGPDKDYPYAKASDTPGPIRPLQRRCVICGTAHQPGGQLSPLLEPDCLGESHVPF